MYVNFLNENQNKAFTGIYQMVIDNIYLSNVFALGPVQAEVHLTYIEPFLRRIDLCNLMCVNYIFLTLMEISVLVRNRFQMLFGWVYDSSIVSHTYSSRFCFYQEMVTLQLALSSHR